MLCPLAIALSENVGAGMIAIQPGLISLEYGSDRIGLERSRRPGNGDLSRLGAVATRSITHLLHFVNA